MNINQINHELAVIQTIDFYIKNVKKKDYIVLLNSHLVNDLGIDSLDVIELGFLLEEKFSIKIEIDLLMGISASYVSDLVKFIKDNQC